MIRAKKTKRFYAVILLFLIISIIIGKRLSSSLFFSPQERLNIVFYGPNTVFYSMGVTDGVDYYVSLYPDLKVQVPGGYGYYRVGALGKLIALEKKPEVFRKAISLTTTTFVNYYFYTPSSQVYYGNKEKLSLPNFQKVFLSSSNAGFFDKLYIWLFFANSRQNQISELTEMAILQKQGDFVFSHEDFIRMYQGYFYQKTFRTEKKNVQILYAKKYLNADRIGSILQGTGIRVSDISSDKRIIKNCLLVENSDTYSQTTRAVASYFGCKMKKGDTDIYDILFILGSLEESWEMEK